VITLLISQQFNRNRKYKPKTNSMRITNTVQTLLGVSLLCGAGLTARADDSVTFQVDMSRYTNSAGAQAASLVDVSGAFNGWGGGWNLVNNGANVYTNTFTVVGAAASTAQYKFRYTTIAGITWEDSTPPPPNAGGNRLLTLVGGAQTLPVVEFYAPSVTPPIDFFPQPITFNVNMSALTNSAGAPAYTAVNASGAFNGWGQSPLVDSGGGIYTNTFTVAASGNYKYTMVLNGSTVYEDGADHPFTFNGSPQTLPLLAFNNSGRVPIDFVTNDITFQVDMQVQGVAFINAGGIVRVSGGFNGWGAGNDLILSHDYVYTNTLSIAYQQAYPGWSPAAQFINAYKFRANGGWEEPTVNPLFGNNDRRLSGLYTGATTLPLALYSDASLCDVLHQDTTVTFRLHLTNGTVDTAGHVFNSAVDTVYLNGESALGSWEPWNPLFLTTTLSNNPTGSDFYECTLVIPDGRPRNQKVKYSFDGLDHEAGFNQDHVQWIRTTNTSYVMSPVEFGTNYASVRVQAQYGDLKAGAPSGGSVPVTWLGCECVTLQTRSSLTSGSWVNLPATESESSTNYPNTGSQFFRLQKRPTP
jgi:hypothetical protein